MIIRAYPGTPLRPYRGRYSYATFSMQRFEKAVGHGSDSDTARQRIPIPSASLAFRAPVTMTAADAAKAFQKIQSALHDVPCSARLTWVEAAQHWLVEAATSAGAVYPLSKPCLTLRTAYQVLENYFPSCFTTKLMPLVANLGGDIAWAVHDLGLVDVVLDTSRRSRSGRFSVERVLVRTPNVRVRWAYTIPLSGSDTTFLARSEGLLCPDCRGTLVPSPGNGKLRVCAGAGSDPDCQSQWIATTSDRGLVLHRADPNWRPEFLRPLARQCDVDNVLVPTSTLDRHDGAGEVAAFFTRLAALGCTALWPYALTDGVVPGTGLHFTDGRSCVCTGPVRIGPGEVLQVLASSSSPDASGDFWASLTHKSDGTCLIRSVTPAWVRRVQKWASVHDSSVSVSEDGILRRFCPFNQAKLFSYRVSEAGFERRVYLDGQLIEDWSPSRLVDGDTVREVIFREFSADHAIVAVSGFPCHTTK